jgi:hypothetical protein
MNGGDKLRKKNRGNRRKRYRHAMKTRAVSKPRKRFSRERTSERESDLLSYEKRNLNRKKHKRNLSSRKILKAYEKI